MNKIQKQDSLCNSNVDDFKYKSKLMRGERSKIYIFVINTGSIVMVGRTMASIKHGRNN
jgi:hypothetical protein